MVIFTTQPPLLLGLNRKYLLLSEEVVGASLFRALPLEVVYVYIIRHIAWFWLLIG